MIGSTIAGRGAGLAAGVALGLMLAAGPAAAQNRPNYFPNGPFVVPVPGQNVSPPAPRNNTAPSPPPITRPGEIGATGRFQGGYSPPLYPNQNRAYPR